LIVPRTLFAKLLLLFLGFGALMGVAFLFVMRVSHEQYHLEFDQLAMRDLARQYVDANLLVREPPLTAHNVADSLARITSINPDIDAYVLDGRGEILASSRQGDAVVRKRVDLEPVARFLEPNAKFPLRGDDPAGAKRTQVFTAARLSIPGWEAAYLYIVLNRHEVSSAAAALKKTYAIGEGAGVVLTAVVLAIAGSVVFLRLMTRRLGVLERSMTRFRDSEFSGPVETAANDEEERSPDDEIERLRRLFMQLAERTRRQLADLHKNDDLRRELVANLSHDLRTPLTTLQAHLELLADNEGASEEERRAHVAVTVQQCRRLVKLVEQLLELARLDAQQVMVSLEPFQLAELIQDIAMKRSLDARRVGVSIDAVRPQDLPLVLGDIGLIERVVDNLLDNAIRHAGPQGRVTVRLTAGVETVRVQIHNTGPGIAEADRDRLFERFYRGDKSRGTQSGNSGLGLSIARGIVELHQSDIGFSSNATDGTNFFFELKIAASRGAAGAPASTTAARFSAA
jgi:signal transduction histidine kinase